MFSPYKSPNERALFGNPHSAALEGNERFLHRVNGGNDGVVVPTQANSEHDGGVLWLFPAGFNHGLLELDGRTEGVHGAGKLGQPTVPGQLDRPSRSRRSP